MKICQQHWDKLRRAIEDRGMTHLVSSSSSQAVVSLANQLKGTDTAADFDPLMNATGAIYATYVADAGLDSMMGDKCPLCEVGGLAGNWINGACDDQLSRARKLGLVPGGQ